MVDLNCREADRMHVIFQINRGHEDIEREDYSMRSHKVFLFRTPGQFIVEYLLSMKSNDQINYKELY